MTKRVPGTTLVDISTPALIVDLDAFERNLDAMRRFVEQAGVSLRAHAKTHKSADIAKLQMSRGGAVGICCQKVSEAEALAAEGVSDLLISNEVTDPVKIERLAALAAKTRLSVCVDDASVIAPLSEACLRQDVTLDCLVEIDVGAGRCGVAPGEPALDLASAIAVADALRFKGLQAYHGGAQHIRDFSERKATVDAVIAHAASTAALLSANGLACETVTGAGTGSFAFEAASDVYTELQCGSYIFMDADYKRVFDADGAPLAFENSLFILTGIMSVAKPGRAVCDAGLKVMSAESGLPTIWQRSDLDYVDISDEHGVIADPRDTLRLNDRLMLVPGHCDPTCNLHERYIGLRGGVVETVWPVTARGMAV